jgi:hypothetical protein
MSNAARSGAPLVINTDLRSPKQELGSKLSSKEFPRQLARRERHSLRRTSADLLKNIDGLRKTQERLYKCGWVPIADGIQVLKSTVARANYGAGICHCGLGLLCPVCAQGISEYKRNEIRTGLERWFIQGKSAFMATFTIQHQAQNENGEFYSLADTLSKIQTAIRWFKSGKGWQSLKAKYKIIGDIKAVEITVSLGNGWHPHLHILFFCEMENIPDETAQDIKNDFYKRWFDLLDKQGEFANYEHGVDVRAGTLGVGDYLAKMGLEGVDYELAKANTKLGRDNGHYSPFELLKLAQAGDNWAAERFKDFAKSVHGLTAIKWSGGKPGFTLRERLGLAADEKQEAEIAQEVATQEKQVYYVMDNFVFIRVRQLNGRCQTAHHLEKAEEYLNPQDFEDYLYERFSEPIE